LRIEHSRKHGWFDARYPAAGHKPPPARLWHLGDERLDWQRFHGRFFPDSRRHDFDALTAYDAYRDAAQAPPADGSRTAGVSQILQHSTRREDEEQPPATPDTDRWEADGGASAARPRGRRSSEPPVGTPRV
jgi:hypothetical protein